MAEPSDRRAVEWTLSTEDETRTYTQKPLTIFGEGRALALVRKIGDVVLSEQADIDLSAIGRMIDEGDIDWAVVLKVLELIGEQGPELIVDSTCLMLGIFPVIKGGEPNPEYDNHWDFIGRSIRFAMWTEMVQTFITQNDYQRLARPFFTRIWEQMQTTFQQTVATGAAPTTDPSPSSPVPGTATPKRSSGTTRSRTMSAS
jgi:hypothetical protein